MLGAISGIGGGVLIKPMLDMLLPLGISQISLLSSFTVLCMALYSVAQNHFRKSKQSLEMRIAMPLAIGSTVGGTLGKLCFNWLRVLLNADATVKTIQNVLLMLLILAVLLVTYRRRESAPVSRPWWAGLSVCFALGLLAAFLGVGGGPFNMLVLTMMYGMTHKQGALYSLLIIVFSQLSGIVVALLSGSAMPEAPLLLVACVAGVLGGICGRAVARRVSDQTVRTLYSAALVAIIVVCAVNIASQLS